MILTKNVDIKINGKMIKYYKDKGYNIKGSNNSYKINVSELPENSHIKINVKCENCDNIRNIPYREYLDCLKSYNIYYCKKCSKIKVERTCLEKYGVKKPLQNKEIKKKQENTTKLKFGVINAFSSKLIKDKIKQTNLEKYGTENIQQLDIIKNKIKYTNNKKYNCDYPFQNKKIRNKSKLTWLKKYNCDNPMKNEEIKQKLQHILKEKGYIFSNDEFNIYKNNVRKITRRYKKELFNNWDGYDFYDKRYIKENLDIHPNDKNYPTIDHKISVLNGFLNKIDYNIIGNIDNLCITKRSINSSKSIKNHDDFKKIINEI